MKNFYYNNLQTLLADNKSVVLALGFLVTVTVLFVGPLAALAGLGQ
jgi:hypothetical protein